MFRNELRSRYGGMVGSAVHDHIIIAAPHLADGACVHAPVWAGYKRDFESLCIHKVPQTGTAESSDGLDHLRGQLHLLVDLLLAHRGVQLVHKSVLLCIKSEYSDKE